ncbi:MAG: hydroxymethylglutaryl-CoA lyase [Acidimicrobiia bacterium]|nr:hydroxymethylglutaryl-CoA lyase [Acidimicrobiia bacterium]
MQSAGIEALRGEPITIVEVGPRDGLQNEPAQVATADKVAFINLLSAAKVPVIEVSAFVSPKWVPQMADAAEVFQRIARRSDIRYTALVPNSRGLERALAVGVREIAVFAAASESFSRRNINQSIDESLATYRDVCAQATAAGVRVRGYLSTAFGCPYEGAVSIEAVVRRVEQLLDLGVFEVAVSDTIGIAHPGAVTATLDAILARVPATHVALHFHDTRGTALANVLAGLLSGIRTFDASAGGLGGCPYAPGAAGNLATDDLVFMLDGLGMRSGVDAHALDAATTFIGSRLDHALPSRVVQARRASRSA